METKPTEAKAPGAEAKKDNVRELNKTLPRANAQALTLAQTIKIVTDLQRMVKHRDLLEFYRDTLSEFELKGKDDDLDDKAPFSNCILKLNDGNGRNFEVKAPSVIKAVVEFLHMRFDVLLKETEAKILLPAVNAA